MDLCWHSVHAWYAFASTIVVLTIVCVCVWVCTCVYVCERETLTTTAHHMISGKATALNHAVWDNHRLNMYVCHENKREVKSPTDPHRTSTRAPVHTRVLAWSVPHWCLLCNEEPLRKYPHTSTYSPNWCQCFVSGRKMSWRFDGWKRLPKIFPFVYCLASMIIMSRV